MADQIGAASTMVGSARGNVCTDKPRAVTARHPFRDHRSCAEWWGGGTIMTAPPPTPEEIARGLTPAMRRALRQRQQDMLGATPTVTGHGMTMRGLRARGVVAGAMPFARLTDLGAAVIAAATLDTLNHSAGAPANPGD